MEKINKAILAAFAFVMVVALFAMPAKAISSSQYTVDSTTYPITEVATIAAQIAGNVAIEQIWIAASSTDTAQTVSVYNYCASTTTAALVWRGYIAAGASVAVPTIHLNYPLFNTPLYLTEPCFRKSGIGSDVQFSVHYR